MIGNSSLPPVNEKFANTIAFIEEITNNTESLQLKVLSEILAQNASTEYLQRFNLDGATDRDSFKSRVPVITYEDLLPDIRRIANGDRSPILCSHPIFEFLISSGTSAGEGKLIPVTREEQERRQLFISFFMPVINQYIPGLNKGKFLYFLFIRAETKTPSGLLAHPVSTSYCKTKQFKMNNNTTSPDEAILCEDSFQSMYTQILCGLIMRHEVLRVGTLFPSCLLRVIKFLQLNWRQLAHDISAGTLNPKITDVSIRSRMAQILKPNPDLAHFIIKECEGENWECIIPRIWPNTKYLDVVVTGAMAQYIPLLDFYSGGLHKASMIYSTSECCIGLNLNPMAQPSEVSYTIMPNMAYFEFIPHEPAKDDLPQKLVDLADVEIGKQYEPVVSTYSGLYRYQVGDILQVTGFHHSAPQFKLIRRKNVLLSIDHDKTDESDLQKAVENAATLLQEFDTTVVEFTSYADTSSIPGHYVIYWELLVKDPSNSPTDHVLVKCCNVMEESLNSMYRMCRVEDSVGPLEIRVVRSGTFEELMDCRISRGTSISQYKLPKCISYTPYIELLDTRVVSAHLSPAAPYWTTEWRS